MGANYFGYCADITCSFPANGIFTESKFILAFAKLSSNSYLLTEQKLIYNAVLAANMAVQETARDGVSWVDMHKLANRVVLSHLKEIGILKGEINDMMEAGINGIFQPHGLGHLIGLDVHDVGGYLETCPPRPTEPGITGLRFARRLKAGMYVTIEPGCYFIDHLLDQALADSEQSKFFVPDVLKQYRGFGGVRIEDDVLITQNGIENFSIVPRT